MINWNYIDAAQKLIERLFDEIKLLRKQIEQQDTIEKSIKNEKDEWKKISQSLKIKLDNITREKVRLSNRLNQYDTNRRIELQKLQKQYNGSLNIYRNQNNQLSQQVAELKRQKETLNQNLAEAEASQSRLLAKVAHQNQDARIHYDATSNRPQHHLLIDKYKTLKEQYFHSLAVSLFNFMEKSNPELNKQRKAKLNEIKAAISVTVLMGGHEIMKRKTDEVEELPPKLL